MADRSSRPEPRRDRLLCLRSFLTESRLQFVIIVLTAYGNVTSIPGLCNTEQEACFNGLCRAVLPFHLPGAGANRGGNADGLVAAAVQQLKYTAFSMSL